MQPIISVALLPKLLSANWAQAAPLAIVIDTLRFTSTACVALSAGARAITVVSDIDGAKRAGSVMPDGAQLCGERNCVKIPGFDLGNSPLEYTAAHVAGRELIFSTTNGTVAVEAALPAREIVLASLLNRGAVCQWLRAQALASDAAASELHVWCICAGTDGQVALEDVLTAGAIVAELCKHDPKWQLGNDSSWLARDAWNHVLADHLPDNDATDCNAIGNQAIVERLRIAIGGRNLIEAGFEADLAAVARLDGYAVVPRQQSPGRFVAS